MPQRQTRWMLLTLTVHRPFSYRRHFLLQRARSISELCSSPIDLAAIRDVAMGLIVLLALDEVDTQLLQPLFTLEEVVEVACCLAFPADV